MISFAAISVPPVVPPERKTIPQPAPNRIPPAIALRKISFVSGVKSVHISAVRPETAIATTVPKRKRQPNT